MRLPQRRAGLSAGDAATSDVEFHVFACPSLLVSGRSWMRKSSMSLRRRLRDEADSAGYSASGYVARALAAHLT